jgi:CHAT domain-containing protein
MKRLLILLLPLLFSCTQNKEPTAVKTIDRFLLQQQVKEREKDIACITNTATKNWNRADTLRLLELCRQQAEDNRVLGHWEQFAQYYLKRYDYASDSTWDFRISCLSSIIDYEDSLAKVDTLHKWLADAYFNRADEWNKQQRHHKITDDGEKYFFYARHEPDIEFTNYLSTIVGNAWVRIGDLQQGFFYLKQELQTASQLKDHEEIAVASINLANAYRENGDYEKAVQTVNSALQLINISPARRAYLNAVLAETYNKQGLPENAFKYVNVSLPLLHNLPEYEKRKNEKLSTVYKVKGDVMATANKPIEALEDYSLAINYAKKDDPDLKSREAGKTFISMGKVHQQFGMADSALYYYNLAMVSIFPEKSAISLSHLPDEHQLWHENTIMEIMDAASVAYIRKYESTKDVLQLQKSLQCIQIAFKVEALLRQKYIYETSKYTEGAESRKRSERGMQTCQKLWLATQETKWLNEAFLFAEKSRANVLMDKIKENLLFSTANDSGFAESRQTWHKINDLKDRITQMGGDTGKVVEVQVLTKEKEAYESKYSHSKNRINSLLNEKYAPGKKQDVDLPAIRQNLLRKHDAVIEYFAGDSTLYRFVLVKGNDAVEMTAQPLQTANAKVRELLPYLISKEPYNKNPESYTAIATRLNQLIFPSFANNRQRVEKLLVIPDGLLQLLPFEALMGTEGKAEFLLKRFQFTTAFSCTSMLWQMNSTEAPAETEGLLIAPFMKEGLRSLPALPQSKEEGKALVRMCSSTNILKDGTATAGKFMQLASGSRILHIASHAFANASDSLQPRIEFADSSITLEKIYPMQLNNRLVVLSACQTGIGQMDAAEGALSLARAFYSAGARNVVNSLWEVDDQSAGLIFTHFYKRLKKTGNITQALSAARRNYFAQASPEKQSPYYWASFVSIGDGDYAESAVKSRFRFLLICLGGLLGIALLMFLFRRRKGLISPASPGI